MKTYIFKIIDLIDFFRRIRTKACTLGHSSVKRPEKRGTATSTERPPRDTGSVGPGEEHGEGGGRGEGGGTASHYVATSRGEVLKIDHWIQEHGCLAWQAT